MSRHISEQDLALYVSRDLNVWTRGQVRLHLSGCESCRGLVEGYRQDRTRVREVAAELPEGLNWDRLASEMTGNIRVGLAAGECVAPRPRKQIGFDWRPAAVAAGLVLLMVGAWWLNMPEARTVVEASSSGIELRQNGSSLGVSQGAAVPVAFSVSVQGSASARYVDADTGQITITSVYDVR